MTLAQSVTAVRSISTPRNLPPSFQKDQRGWRRDDSSLVDSGRRRVARRSRVDDFQQIGFDFALLCVGLPTSERARTRVAMPCCLARHAFWPPNAPSCKARATLPLLSQVVSLDSDADFSFANFLRRKKGPVPFRSSSRTSAGSSVIQAQRSKAHRMGPRRRTTLLLLLPPPKPCLLCCSGLHQLSYPLRPMSSTPEGSSASSAKAARASVESRPKQPPTCLECRNRRVKCGWGGEPGVGPCVICTKLGKPFVCAPRSCASRSRLFLNAVALGLLQEATPGLDR